MHICNGNFKGRPISPSVRNAPWVEIFQRLDGVVDVAAMECSYPEVPSFVTVEIGRDAGVLPVLRSCPTGYV
jgi:hypothetical protein